MSMQRTAIIDTTTLVSFTYLKDLGIFHYLRSYFHRVHIPTKVKTEYEAMLGREPSREWVLERLRLNEGFYSLCTKYDLITLQIYKTVAGIDDGEAEAAAQQKVVGATYILSDDVIFSNALKQIDRHIKVITTLHVIALLDMNQLLSNRDEILRTFHRRRKFKSIHLRQAYTEIVAGLGLQMHKKVLNAKTSMKALGLA
ncbi:hypothetical protein [Chryseolinea lacunae]|uniref:PIN domain-containing protein n=1 Tax=Chryseolinea lacunae TaxID=2801331 RepID=A0ABS1L007_9BACT|nr:hypothetical protein [Chryseolinea lacunae]MBL0745014.1 hypothetical protein [Chryseolinea lacunae]